MTDRQPGEFELIQRYFADAFHSQVAASPHLVAGIGDDCAILNLPPQQQLLVSVDTLNEGVHFPANADPQQLARRALAVAVSDLAAMGAEPLGFSLSLGAPSLSEAWLAGFSTGLCAAAADFAIALIGGDTTRSEKLSLAVQVLGCAPAGRALRRGAASEGDGIYVSGSLGDARAALECLDVPEPDAEQAYLLNRYWSPTPRLALGQALRELASTAIDISDGLAGDLAHILRASGLGGCIEVAALPLSPQLCRVVGEETAKAFALSGGDDYELCFTAPASAAAQLHVLSEQLAIPLTRIGLVDSEPGLRCVDEAGKPVSPAGSYQHF